MKTHILAAAAVVAAVLASPAMAYIGPGAGVGAFGTLIALIGSAVLLIVGFVWYPIRRVLRRRRRRAQSNAPTTPEE